MIQKTYEDEKKHIHVLSYGGGTQSTALLLKALKGEVNGIIPDYIIFSDTGWEPKEVTEWVAKINDYIKKEFGKEIITTGAGDIRDEVFKSSRNGFVTMPVHSRNDDGKKSMGMRQCTGIYKIFPVNKEIRRQLGYAPRKRVKEMVHVWKGISTDEIQRAKPMRDIWQTAEHPLIDVLEMDRGDCIKYVESLGLGTPPRSACIGCPFNNKARWLEVKQNPEAWKSAVEVDRALRLVNPDTFLHRSLKPLEEVEFKEQLDFDHMINECEGFCGV